MQHYRRVIRRAVVAGLKAAGTAAGQRVQAHPFDARAEFPGLVVEDAGALLSDGVTETQQAGSMPGGPSRPIGRRYRFAVRAEVKQSDNADDERDDLIAEVEAWVASADIPGVKTIVPVMYQAADSNRGGKPIRTGVQIFEALYFTSQGDPSTPR